MATVTLAPGKSADASRDTMVTWRDACAAVEAALNLRRFAGEFSLRPSRQVRWNVAPGKHSAIKPIHSQQHCVLIRVRPPTGDNGSVWEYYLYPPKEIPASQLRDALAMELATPDDGGDASRHATPGNGSSRKAAVSGNGSSAPEEQPSILARISLLEEAAHRVRQRKSRLASIEIRRKEIQAEIECRRKMLDDLDTQSLSVMDEGAQDRKAAEAAEILEALTRLLTPSTS